MRLPDLVYALALLAYYIAACLILPLFARKLLGLRTEVARKLQHIGICLSIFPTLGWFSTWYSAILGMFLLPVVAWPVLCLLEKRSWYCEVFAIRHRGELHESMMAILWTFSVLIAIFWGLAGPGGKSVIAAAVTSWGFGDAAAALVGKRFGRTPVRSHLIESAKTWEGAAAMLVVSGLALIVTLHFYGGCPLDGCIQAAFVLAPILAAVELLSRRGSDTVTLPLTAAFLLLPLLRWMGALAVAG